VKSAARHGVPAGLKCQRYLRSASGEEAVPACQQITRVCLGVYVCEREREVVCEDQSWQIVCYGRSSAGSNVCLDGEKDWGPEPMQPLQSQARHAAMTLLWHRRVAFFFERYSVDSSLCANCGVQCLGVHDRLNRPASLSRSRWRSEQSMQTETHDVTHPLYKTYKTIQ